MKKIDLSTVICFIVLPTLLQACNVQSTPSLPSLPSIDMNSLGSMDSQEREGFNAFNQLVENLNEHGQKIYFSLQVLNRTHASNFSHYYQALASVIPEYFQSASTRAKMLSAAKKVLESLKATFDGAEKAGLHIDDVPYVKQMRQNIDLTIKALNAAIATLKLHPALIKKGD